MNKKYKRYMQIFFMFAGILLLVGCSSLKKEEGPGIFEYYLKPDGENRLAVTLRITNPSTSAKREFSFPSVGENIELDESSKQTLWIESGKTKELKYHVNLGEDGKHGAQGIINDKFCVFDGIHTLLLPEEAYVEGISNEEVLMKQLSINLESEKGWMEVNPFEMKKNVTWPDLYDLMNDCFAMGEFERRKINVEDGKLNIYSPQGEKWTQDVIYEEALKSLLSYYQNLFTLKKQYSVIFLPGEKQIIGGAGSHSVGASFNPENARDWELLSHRMFHAFLYSSLHGQALHTAPLLWFSEGLATYYENIALQQMPESMKISYGWKDDLQFAKLYDQYLYMRCKEPVLYQIAPMEEEGLKSQAQVEFLHYIQAPLMIKRMETIAGKDSVLNEFLKCYEWDSFSMEDMVKQLLKDDYEENWKNYFVGKEIIPLWQLGKTVRDDSTIVEHLNSAEWMLGSWLNKELEYYPIEEISIEELDSLKENNDLNQFSYADSETEKNIQEYSKLIDELLKANCLKIKEAGFEIGDPMARYEYLKNMDGREK